jgi:hypothetical protein
VVTDAAWTLSAGPDAARLDAAQGSEVSGDAAQRRWAMNQVLQATVRDHTVAVSFMVAHPSILAEPALLDLAVRANEAAALR